MALCLIDLTSAELKIAVRGFGELMLDYILNERLTRPADVLSVPVNALTADNQCPIAQLLAISLQLFAFSFTSLSLQLNSLLQLKSVPFFVPSSLSF